MARILVIEHYEPLRSLLRMALEQEGHAVETAACGAEGLGCAAAWRPDLVLLDTELPDAKGHVICRKMLAGGGEAAPVLMMTGWPLPGSHQRALDAGARGLLLKPFTGEQLLGEVSRMLAGAGMVRGAG